MSLEKIVDDSFNLIKKIRTEILKKQKIFNLTSMSNIQYRKEFATIRLTLPRRMGNTTLALKCFKYFKDSVLIVCNINMKNNLLSYNKSLKSKINRISTPGTIKSGYKVKTVIVDTASWILDLDTIYKIEADLYILLG